MSAVQWSDAERRAWRWPDHLSPSQWAQKYRVLQGGDNAEPGPWRNERNPLMVAIMDAFVEPGVEEIVVRKAGQVGWSEAIRNIVGWVVDHEPGPCLMVLPDQKSAEELFNERLRPLIEHTPAVGRHATSRAWDIKSRSIRFDTCSVYAAWAGSSQSTKSRQIRYAFCDEPDEYPAHSGTGGDPIAKVGVRLRTFKAKKRARLLLGGTPTTRLGNVCKHFELANEKRYAWVPCPHCGKFQQLAWKRVKWPTAKELGESDRVKHAARVSGEDLAWYECEHCQGKIVDRLHKSAMLRRHVWAGEDQAVTPDGRVVGPPARSKRRVAFHYPAQYSPWVRWSEMAGDFILAQDDPAALMDFVNQSLAEPWEEQRQKTKPRVIELKAERMVKAAGPAGWSAIIPHWARWLIATADTQGTTEADGYFWFVVRAWGYGERSQGIDFGVAHTKDELRERTILRTFPIDGKAGAMATPQGLWVDSGGPRWKEIYEMARSDPRVHPTRGSSTSLIGMMEGAPQKKHAIVLEYIDTAKAKDQLHRLVNDSNDDLWMPPGNANDDYCRQMCAEQKIFDPAKRQELWTEVIKDSNHLWDCEAIQAAVAWRQGCWMPAPTEEPRQRRDESESGRGNPLDYRGRW